MIQTIQQIFQKVIGYFFPLTNRMNAVRLGIVIIAVISISVFGSGNAVTENAGPRIPLVFVGTVQDVISSDRASFVGTVRAVDEAQIQSEIGGRVTSVRVQPGDSVSAGAIIGSLENASEQASLLQAQGTYEIALANAAQSEVSRDDAQNTLLTAENNAINTYRNSYTSVYTVTLNTIDIFFSDPNAQTTPGVRIATGSNTTSLNKARIELRKTLDTWRNTSNSLTNSSDLNGALKDAEKNTRAVIELTDIFIRATSDAKTTETLDGKPVTSYTGILTTARATLNSTLTTISSAETTLTNARENLRRAEIGSTQNTDASLARAQVKQALGALRSAEANYEKTIFRAPIAGTVNSVRIHTGDFVPAFTQIAEVANNNALQISIYVGENDLTRFVRGGTVTINNTVPGTIISIAPAVDAITKKTEIIIATESAELTNGSTVTIQLNAQQAIEKIIDTPLLVPITAIKFNATNGSLFLVEDGTLVARPVTIGSISGSLVTIMDGIDLNTQFVLDARGLTEGQSVETSEKK